MRGFFLRSCRAGLDPPSMAPPSERQLRAQVQAVVALVAVGEAAVVADPRRERLAELGVDAEARAAPGLVGREARHREGTRHVDEARAHVALIGLAVVVPRDLRERMQGGAAGLP